MSHLTYSNALCHEYQCVISHTSMSHVIYINEFSFTKIRIACIWVRHVTKIHESSQLHQWGTSYMWTGHVMKFNASCHMCEWIMSRTSTSHVTYMNESCHIRECVMSNGRVIRVNASCHIHDWVTSQIWRSHFTCINASWRMYKESCHIQSWGVPYYINESCRIIWISHIILYEWVVSHIAMIHAIYMNESRHVHTSVMS